MPTRSIASPNISFDSRDMRPGVVTVDCGTIIDLVDALKAPSAWGKTGTDDAGCKAS